MHTDTMAGTPAAAGLDHYRTAEARLWAEAGVVPREQFIEISTPKARLRVVEVGPPDGPPVLFIPGTAGVGPSWSKLVRELPGVRALLLDRPGWGLSSPIVWHQPYDELTVEIIRAVADGLGLERFDVVGASVGNVWALRAAAAMPSRIGRVVLLGGGPMAPEQTPPPFFKLLVSPIGAVLVRLPQKAARIRSILESLGHGPSLADGRISDAYLDWRVAFDNETPSMRHERSMVRTLIKGGRFVPRLTFSETALRAVQQPVLMAWGSSDPIGSAELWRRFVAQLPNGQLEVVDGAGHIPWLDQPKLIGDRVRGWIAD